ncbi:MAG: DUF5663 domain-containing protein [Candidatus Nomurabacteria bacterium]|nr:DUF5663 domain-containing protein [Candidatus Nomurabacteria bacterium]
MSQNTNVASVKNMNEEFIEKLIVEAGMAIDLDAEVLTQLKKDMLDRLEDRINAVILSNIPEYKLGEFEKVLDSDDEKAISDFYTATIPNMAEVLAGEYLDFRTRYIA